MAQVAAQIQSAGDHAPGHRRPRERLPRIERDRFYHGASCVERPAGAAHLLAEILDGLLAAALQRPVRVQHGVGHRRFRIFAVEHDHVVLAPLLLRLEQLLERFRDHPRARPERAEGHATGCVDDVRRVRQRAVFSVDLAVQVVDDDRHLHAFFVAKRFRHLHLVLPRLVRRTLLARVRLADIDEQEFHVLAGEILVQLVQPDD